MASLGRALDLAGSEVVMGDGIVDSVGGVGVGCSDDSVEPSLRKSSAEGKD